MEREKGLRPTVPLSNSSSASCTAIVQVGQNPFCFGTCLLRLQDLLCCQTAIKKKKMQWGGKKLKVKLRALVFSTDTALPLVTFQSRWCYCLWYDTIVQWEKSCRHLNLSMLSTFERKRIRGKSWLQAETIANTLEEASASVEQLP